MSLKPFEQLEKAIAKSKDILILLPQNPSGDAIGAGWAFYLFLKDIKKEATIAVNDPFNNIDKFSFLPKPSKITGTISGARDFILSFNTEHNKIIDVKTERKENEIRIHITPEHGAIDPRDFSFIPAKFKYDLVIALDSPDKETLGKIYEENPDIFYEVPVINMDHHNSNDNFGQINLVDITASSTSEIIFSTLQKISPNSLSENISTCLLAGIISSTESFQNRNTTPKSLQISASLMDKGADQQEIIRHLYKTQPLRLLKLWGRVMAHLKWDENLKLAWSLVSIEDFVQSRSKPEDIPLILKKIQDNYSSGKIFLVLYNDTPQSVKGIIKYSQPDEELKITSELEKTKKTGDIYEFNLVSTNIQEAEKEFLQKIKISFSKNQPAQR